MVTPLDWHAIKERFLTFAYNWVEATPSMAEIKATLETFDWEQASPIAIGSILQSIMQPQARRQLGAHYTDETNILKLVGPPFLDELRNEFERVKTKPKQLFALLAVLTTCPLSIDSEGVMRHSGRD
ncbi:hypothetical protein TI04_09165 [Achromatium sp. WMS2]|nr:hypothetical protein TI04_09165 [Achromatium sp. WMS2]